MSNSIQVIHPYKFHGVWVFDDKDKDLKREPFVAGADKILTVLSRKIHDAKKGFSLVFSGKPFPGYTIELNWVQEEQEGNWYYCPKFKKHGWLCPALMKYFTEVPQKLYVKAEKEDN